MQGTRRLASLALASCLANRSALSAALFMLLLAAAPLALAADPLCCRLFGFDVTPTLGKHAVACGKIVDGDLPGDAETATQVERRRATACALDAQARGEAFVYTYRFLVSPDIDLIVQAVFGEHGERMLMKMGKFHYENIRSVEICETLVVEPDGKLQERGCQPAYPDELGPMRR